MTEQSVPAGTNSAPDALTAAPGPFRIRFICCGHDDGDAIRQTWAEADALRNSYIAVPKEEHDRSAIIEAALLPATRPAASLREALELVTKREPCPHGYLDVVHVAPAHFDGPACPQCSDAPYADEQQRLQPCEVCAALAAPAPALDVEHGALLLAAAMDEAGYKYDLAAAAAILDYLAHPAGEHGTAARLASTGAEE